MTRGMFCDHEQANSRAECEQCGAWIGSISRSRASSDTESATPRTDDAIRVVSAMLGAVVVAVLVWSLW